MVLSEVPSASAPFVICDPLHPALQLAFSDSCTRAKDGPEQLGAGGSDPMKFWADRPQKSGVAPAQSGVFFCVTFLIVVSFISSFSRDLCTSQAEEDGEDEAEGRNSYLLHLLRPNSRRAHRKNFLVGLERPAIHFGHGTSCKSGSLQPTRCHSAGILPIPSRATSSPFGICSVAIVNVKVTDSVICVFHAPFTFQRCKYRSRLFEILESDTSKRPRKWKSSIKMFPSDPLGTVPRICMIESSPSLLYLLGNLLTGKSKKKL